MSQQINLCPFPLDWHTDKQWREINNLNVWEELDPNYKHNGQYTIKISPNVLADPTTENSAFDYWHVPVKPFDIITQQVWAKALYGIHTQEYCGARMGVDIYDAVGGRITGYAKDTMLVGVVLNPVWTSPNNDGFVHFGEDWTFLRVIYQIPPTCTSDGYGAYPVNQQVLPSYLVPWVQDWCSPPQVYPTNAFDVWFSEFALYNSSTVTPPTTKSFAARSIGPFGVPAAALNLLWRAREKVISKEAHKKLHPLV